MCDQKQSNLKADPETAIDNRGLREPHLSKSILTALETCEAICFLTRAPSSSFEHINTLRNQLPRMPRQARLGLVKEAEEWVKLLRDTYGALAPDAEYRRLLADARSYRDRSYWMLSKQHIDSVLFQHYERAFPYWQDARQHFAVVFNFSPPDAFAFFCLEQLLFRDVSFVVDRCREARRDLDAATDRQRADVKLQIYLRSAIGSLYIFLEAYLNGLAYDCHAISCRRLSPTDHDMITEWDHSKKRRKQVSFETKIVNYPAIVARCVGRALDLSGCTAAHYITKEGRALRNALTHPSPFPNPHSKEQEKISKMLTMGLRDVEALFDNIKEYVETVERGLGRETRKSAWWLFDPH